MAAFTDKFIKNRIKTPTKIGVQDEYFDGVDGVSGFGLRVGKSGKKMFFYLYRFNRKMRRHTIGQYGEDWSLGEAREEAKRLRDLIRKGIDPKEQEREDRETRQAERVEKSKRITFEDLAKQYIEQYAKREKKTWKEDEAKLNNYYQDWNTRPVESITTDDILDKLIEIKNLALESTEGRQKGGKYAANRNRALLLVLFKWAKENRKIKENPASNPRDIPKNSEKGRSRKRVLNDDEIKAFWGACENMAYPFGYLFQLMLVTGRREGVTARMKWTDLDFNKSEWSIHWSDDKAGQPQLVALPDMAMGILKHISKDYKIDKSEYVFTTTGEKPVSGFSNAKKTLNKLSGINQAERDKIEQLTNEIKQAMDKGKDTKDIDQELKQLKSRLWVLHDLRRTCRTNLPRAGADRDIAKLAIGHKAEGIDAVYDQYTYYDEIKSALSKYARLLDRIIKDESAKVVKLHG